MIAKYNGEYYLTISPAKKLRIWRYTPVEGFNETKYESGLRVFKKEVNLTDIEEMFTTLFYVRWHGHNYKAILTNNGNAVALIVDMESDDYAHEYSISYDKMLDEYFFVVSINTCEEFYFMKQYVYPENKIEERVLSKEEWVELYQLFEIDLAKCED